LKLKIIFRLFYGRLNNVILSNMENLREKYQYDLEDYTLKTNDELLKIIEDFGCGETEFHTADIELLIKENIQLKAAIIGIIKVFRKEELYYQQKVEFCAEHKMELDKILNYSIEREYRNVCRKLQNEFDTGYIDY
jgi:hypothetical protein